MVSNKLKVGATQMFHLTTEYDRTQRSYVWSACSAFVITNLFSLILHIMYVEEFDDNSAVLVLVVDLYNNQLDKCRV